MIDFKDLSKAEQRRQRRLARKTNVIIESEGGSYSKKVLNTIFRDLRIFVLVIFVLFWKTGAEPTGLIVAVFGFMTVEVWQLARIKVANIEEGNTKEECDDSDNGLSGS